MKKYFKKASALLLSFLIMLALLSSVLYIARISVRQISQSKSVDNANIAFYAAESGNEQAVYYLRKTNVQNISDLSISTPYIFNDISGASISREANDVIYNVNMGLKKDTIFQFDFYDADSVADESNLSYLEISWRDECGDASWLELTAVEWNSDESGSIDWGNSVNMLSHVKKDLLNDSPYTLEEGNEIRTIGGSAIIDPDSTVNKVYMFRVKALFCDVYDLEIAGFNPDNQPLSFKNVYNIKTTGQYPANSNKGNKQALSVSLRSVDPLSGLFDYVVFSEQSIIKDFGLNVDPPNENLYIATPSPVTFTLGSNVYYEIETVNGRDPYTWIVSGSLPSGINFDASKGALIGRPTETDASLINFQVTSNGQSASKSITIKVTR